MQARRLQTTDLTQIQDWANNPLWKALQIRWYWFIASPCFFLLLGLVFLRYKTPHYGITASLLVRDDSRGSDLQETAVLEELGLPDATSSVENEIEILKSRTLLSQVIDDLHLTTQYFASGHLKTTELYEKAPFTLKFLKQRPAKPATYLLTGIKGRYFILETATKRFNGIFGRALKLPHDIVKVDTTRFKPATDCQYSFRISSTEAILAQYSRLLTIQAPNKTASLVNLSIQDVLPHKGEAILKQLILRYQQASIEEKNKVADKTIAFINHNLERITAELILVETNIERFRKRHRLIDMAEDSRLALQKLTGNASEEKELTIRLQVIRSLEAHLREKHATAIPTALYAPESSFAGLAEKFNEMQLQYVKLLSSLPAGHPEARSVNTQIAVVRSNLLDAIQYQKQELMLSITAIREYSKRFETEISRIPGSQRQFLAQSREQGIQQDLYLFLLKKRMETAISRSANIANARIVDPPKAGTIPTKPNRQLTLLIAVLAGMLTPATIIYIQLIFNNKVASKDDISQQCDINIIGEISQQTRAIPLIKAEKRHLMNEQFRSLRTNMQFACSGRPNRVILLTSAMASEGKSFIAAHLAQSLALAGKKVLLVDFDLRRPTLARLLGLEIQGVTESLSLDIAPRIQQCGNQFPFDFLASGEQHPGAGEIVLSPKVGELISALKSSYDYVLLDSPPVGLVADARLIGCHADMTLYIVRQHFTFRHQLADIQKLRTESQLPDINIVLNGTRDQHKYQYSYY